MTESNNKSYEGIKDRNLSLAGKCFREIAKNHLVEAGMLTINNCELYEIWEIHGKSVKPYFYPDPRSKSFITLLSKSTLVSIQEANATIMGVNYFKGIEELLAGMVNYGVVTRATQEKQSIQYILEKIIEIGGITELTTKNHPKAYILHEKIQINVVV